MLFADTEANGFLKDATKLHCIAIGEETGDIDLYADHPGYKPLKDGIARLKAAPKVCFHNGLYYDFWIINRFFPGTFDKDQIVDSLVLSRMMDTDSNHSLADIGERMGFPKGEHTDFSVFTPKMGSYCVRDVEVLRRYWSRPRPKQKFRTDPDPHEGYSLARFYAEFERAVWVEHRVGYALSKQEQHGFRLDVKKAQALEAELRQEQLDIERRLQDIFPPIVTERYSAKTGKRLKDGIEVFNPASRQQIAKRFSTQYGWKPTKFTPSGSPQIDEEVLRGLDYPEAKELLKYLRVEKQLGQLSDGKNGWLKLVTPQGYVHGKINQCGARTHRMSHFAPNMAQVDKKDLRMRDVWTADDGLVLVGCDADGLELRMEAHYLAKWDGGAFIKILMEGKKENGTDAHSRNRDLVGLRTRDGAKTLIYAFNYGAGDEKLALIWLHDTGEISVSVHSRKALGAKIRKKLEEGITGLGKLTELCKKRHREKGYLVSLDGRRIKSGSQHSALNTLLQGAGAIVMKWALALFDDEVEGNPRWHNVPIFYCANVHDEVQITCPREYAEEIGKLFADCITRAGLELGVKCPLLGDFKIGNTWKDTH